MANFRIAASRRLDLESCEFDVDAVTGVLIPGELFRIEGKGSPWEYIIVAAKERVGITTLSCIPWIPESGAFVGMNTESRPMKAIERKRYAKIWPRA